MRWSRFFIVVVRIAVAVIVFTALGDYVRAPLWAVVFAIVGVCWADNAAAGYGRLQKQVSRVLCELRGHIGNPNQLVGKLKETAPCFVCGEPYLMKTPGNDRLWINPEYEHTILSRLEQIEATLGIEPSSSLKYLDGRK